MDDDSKKLICAHKTLYFGSGAYYLICKDCNQLWAALKCEASDEHGRAQFATNLGTSPLTGQERVALLK